MNIPHDRDEKQAGRIVFIAGPRKGYLHILNSEETSIGRDASNTVHLNHSSVSRHHCIIRREAEKYRLSDLQSLNGTFVDRLPVSARVLEHGNEVRVGDSLFVFLERPDESFEHTSVVSDDSVPRTTIRLRLEDAWYLQSRKVEAALARDAGLAGTLNALLKISTAVSHLSEPNQFYGSLMESVLDAVPADRAALFLMREGEPVPVFRFPEDQEIKISRTVMHEVLPGVSVLCEDVRTSTMQASQSLLDAQVQSLLCVPLSLRGETAGMIYLESMDPGRSCREQQLQFLAAVGAIASSGLENMHHRRMLFEEVQWLREEVSVKHNMVGESTQMRELFDFIRKVAPTDSTVLILGESGTGKELLARALHGNSPRASKPFVAINCATLSDTLLESELFGHERGAFTGAIAQKKGKLELADTGTVFLDEVAELSLPVQARLLRMLQEREFERVGGTRPIRVDVRMIAATNHDLKKALSEARFREDLFYRLNVVSVRVPPLRERAADIPLLIQHFLFLYSEKLQKRIQGVSENARQYLLRYSWPGNIRELQNAMERSVVMCESDWILPEDLPENILEQDTPGRPVAARYQEALLQTKKELILNAFREASGNYTETARRLGVHPNYLHRLIRNLNLKSLLIQEKG